MSNITADRFWFKFFRNTSNSINMNVNGSVTPVDFKVTGVSSGSILVERINIQIVDGSMTYGSFGGIASLTNGVEIKCFDEDDTLLIDFTDGHNIHENEDWCVLSGVDGVVDTAAGDDFMPIRWTISKAGAQLRLRTGDYIRIRIQDNLTGITSFTAMAQGVKL